MPAFVGANIKDKSGENDIWVATDFFGPGEVTITVDDFLNSGGQSASGGTTEHKSPIELGITAISLTVGGNALASDYVLTLSPYTNNTFYDATQTKKITKILHNGEEYELGGEEYTAGEGINIASGNAITNIGVLPSSQSGNILTSGMKIWAGLETDYQNLGSYDQNTLYLTI